MNDNTLVRRTNSGDMRAFEVLVHRHSATIINFVHRFMPDPQDAEDIAQEVFILAYRSLQRFDPALGRFQSWLFSIAANTSINELKRRKRMAVRDGIAGQIQEEIGQITWDPQKEFGTITALREALQSLPESERQIVLMNRAAVPIEEIEESLKNLKDYNSEVSLLILIPEGSGSGDRGYNIVKIANRLGIIKVSVKTIKP